MAETAFSEGEWESGDGLTLHYRDYAGGTEENRRRPPILCLHGLTRNARDFEALAKRFAGEWRLIVPDMRGRGHSEYARDSVSYNLDTYVADVVALLDKLRCGPVVIVGTSMGGLMAIAMAASNAWPLAAVVLNDIGPDLEPAGLERILETVGQGGSFETWMHAARHMREQTGSQHPGFEINDWLEFAKRVMVVGENGRIVFDYDMRIAEPLQAAGGRVSDLWPAVRAFARTPALLLRGEVTDLLSPATVGRMQQELPHLRAVTVPGVGHPPTLAEPEAQAAIAELLAEVA